MCTPWPRELTCGEPVPFLSGPLAGVLLCQNKVKVGLQGCLHLHGNFKQKLVVCPLRASTGSMCDTCTLLGPRLFEDDPLVSWRLGQLPIGGA